MEQRYWDVWASKDKVTAVLPALGTEDNVFGGQIPSWFPNDIKSVLDCGCGNALFYKFFTNQGLSYTGIDSSPHMIEAAKQAHPDGSFQLDDIFNLSFKRNSFDFVFTNATLIHFPIQEIPKALKELKRVSSKYLCFNLYNSTDDYTLELENNWGLLTSIGDDILKNMIDNIFGTCKTVSIVETSPVKIGTVDSLTLRFLIILK